MSTMSLGHDQILDKLLADLGHEDTASRSNARDHTLDSCEEKQILNGQIGSLDQDDDGDGDEDADSKPGSCYQSETMSDASNSAASSGPPPDPLTRSLAVERWWEATDEREEPMPFLLRSFARNNPGTR